MGDPYDEFLARTTQQAPSTGPVPVQTGAGEDAYAEFLNGAQPTPTAPRSGFGELGRLFAGGVDRNIAQWQSMPDQLLGVYHETQGDMEKAVAYSQKAQATQAPTGESEWSLQKVHDAETFSYWMAEKLGEQSITALASMGTGLGGGLAVNAAAQNLAARGAIGAVSHRAMVLAGMTVPTYALTTALETAGTAEEQFQVTGSTQPQRSIPAGMVKGVLELWTPLSISRALLTPGLQLGKSLPGAIAKLSAKEAATETAQEAIDIYARQLAEPGYSYFKNGPTLAPSGWGEGMWRLAESGAAGGLVGAAFGGPAAVMERRQERNKELGNEPPGFSQTLPPERVTDNGKRLYTTEKLQAAIKTPEGKVYTGFHHGEAFDKAVKDQKLDQQASDDLADKLISGFTVNGKFITTEEAAKQVSKKTGKSYEEIGSEDSDLGVMSKEMIARDQVTIEKDGRHWTASSQFGDVFAVLDRVPGGTFALRVQSSGLQREADIGQGHGAALYKEIFDQALAQGYPVHSDGVVSENAAKNIYESFKKFGYKVEGPKGQLLKDVGGNFYHNLEGPVYKITAAPSQAQKGVAVGGPGPVTTLHNTVVPKKPGGDKLTSEMKAKISADDAIGMSAFLDSKLRVENRMKDIVEAATERYVEVQPDGRMGDRLYTNTEWELENATNRPQAVKPRLLRVRQDMLQIGAITAHLTDLAPANSERVHFVSKMDEATKQQLLQSYAALQAGAKEASVLALQSGFARQEFETAFKPIYDKLLTAGLRVIPSHGSGFYYNGVVEGEEVADLKTTGRFIQPMFYDLMTEKISPYVPGETPEGSILVAVDHNKIESTREADGSYKVKGKLRFDMLTPGITPMLDYAERLETADRGFTSPYPNTRVFVHGLLRESEEMARRIQVAAQTLAPTIDQILRSVGIDKPVGIVITDSRGPGVSPDTPAWARVDDGTIGISPENWDKFFQPQDLERKVLHTLMHELGHIVTYWYYRNLPVEMQDKLYYAWQKGLLALRMGDQTRLSPLLQGQNPGLVAMNWVSFSEWLAEQFRRWASSNSEPKSWLDKTYQEGGKQLEKFYRQWEQRFGEKQASNLAEPDYYFSGFMDYLRGFSEEKNAFKQVLKRDALYEAGQSLLDSPVKFQVLKQVDLGLRSLEGLLLPGQMIRINELLDPKLTPANDPPSPMALGRYIQRQSPNGKELGMIELAVGSLKPEAGYAHGREAGFHETGHAYIDMGLMREEEIAAILEAVKGKEDHYYPKNLRLTHQAQAREFARARGWTEEQAKLIYQRDRDEEYVVRWLTDVVMKGNPAQSEATGKIAAIFAAVMERIRDFMHAIGYPTQESLIRALFRGEFVARYEKRLEQTAVDSWQAEQQVMAREMSPANENKAIKTVEVEPGVLMHVRYMEGQELRNAKGRLYNAAVHYLFTDQQGNLVGSASLKNRGDRGFELSNVSAQAATVGKLSFLNGLLKHVAQDMGIPLWNQENPQDQLAKPAGRLSAGAMPSYRFGLRKTEMGSWLDMYVFDKTTATWFSPNNILKSRAYWNLERARSRRGESRHNPQIIADWLTFFNGLYAKVPTETWSDPRLRQMFMLDRNYKRDEVQGSLLRAGQQVEESKLLASLGYGNPMQDVWQNTFETKQAFSQAEQAKASGLPFDLSAPRSAMTMEMRKTWEKFTGYGESAEARKSIMNTFHEADRIGKYSKYAWTIWQLIWKNEKIVPLTSLGQNTMRMNTLMNGWLRRADETARVWRKITDPKRREGITSTLFGLMEMNYRSSLEVTNKIVRMPMGYVETMPGMADGFLDGRPVVPGSELDRFFKKTGLDPQDHEMVRRVGQDFWQFLRDVEAVRIKNLTNTLAKSPAALQAALADLQKEMTEIRSKPYFPMMRWGEFTVKVKDVNTKELLEFQAFGTRLQRDAAVPEMRRKHPGADIQIGRVASSSVEFMSLPSPLLKTIKEKLFDKVGKTQEQVDLIDQQIAEIEAFELANRPDRTFRKRWMPAHGIPGYNTDAFRAYASYFQYGSRYLARLAYMDDLYADLAALQKTTDNIGNTAKREEIVKYVRDWLKYIMEPGRDSGKFRALVSLWYLGFSPAAAAMNFTQTLTVTIPTLHSHFGREAVSRVMNAGWTASKNVWKTNAPQFLGGSGVVNGNPSYLRAREEMLRQQFIDVGQAPELAAFAEGGNLIKMQAGSKTQEAWLTTLNWGMKMFSVAEQHNRELAFKLSWDLANKYPRTQRLLDLDSIYPTEINEIMTRAGLTHQEAVAFVFAREMIQKTQFVYDKTSDAPFMRGKAKDFLIFFKYTQSMLYAFGNNGAMFQMMLIFAFLYGLNGLPGAEDATAVIDMLDAIGRKFFGKDFRLRYKAREFFTQATAGTPFEKVGPDLALHGVSRYGFGMSFLPSPFAPQFDASSNGSMGRIIPGFAEFVHGQATGKKWPDVFAEAAQKASGAGYGTFFSLMQFLSEGPSADSKKWESVIPRFAKAEAKAWRYGVSTQAETTRSGAKLPSTRFFAGDPDDVATVLAQAAGFQPRKVSQTWEALRAVHEEEEIYKGRRTAIYVQLDKAIQEKNQAAIDEVKVAIDRYNADVKGFDPSYQIGREIMASLKQRQLQRAMTEETSMQNKKQVTVMDRMQKLYPGVELQKVK